MTDQEPGQGQSKVWRNAWASWVGVAIIVNVIWGITWLANSDDGVPYYWPIWVMVPWGAVILAGMVTRGMRK